MKPEQFVLGTDFEIGPNQTASVVRRRDEVMPSGLVLDVDPDVASAFELTDMKVGHSSQLISSAPIAVAALAFTKEFVPWMTETVHAHRDLELVVRNITSTPRRFWTRVHASPRHEAFPMMYPLGTSTKTIGAGQIDRIEAQASVAFRGKHIVLLDHEHFRINDVLIGARSQASAPDYLRRTKIIGRRTAAISCTMDTATRGQSISIVVRNIGTTMRTARAVLWGAAAV